MNITAKYVVPLLRKSAVRLTPNMVPIVAPPNEPANPPPLLACINTMMTSRALTMISSVTKIPNPIIFSDQYLISI